MDKDTRVAIAGILEVSREAKKCASEMRILALHIHKALVIAGAPGYLEAYESRFDKPISELMEAKNKLSHLVDCGIQALRKNCVR